MSLEELLFARFEVVPNSLSAFIEQASCEEKSILQALMAAHHAAENKGTIGPLVNSTAHIYGAKNAFKEILKELGSREEYYPLKEDIQAVARRYLSACGFKRANELLLCSSSTSKHVLDSPESSSAKYHQVVLSQIALKTELEQIYLAINPLLSEEEALGGLVFSLLLRDGALTQAEILRALQEIQAGRLALLDRLWYVYGPIGKDGQQARRLFLSPLTLAFVFRWLSFKPKEQPQISDVNTGLSALADRLVRHHDIQWKGLKDLQGLANRFLRLQSDMPQHVVDYMSGAVTSTSITESCWTQLFEFKAEPEMLIHEQELKSLRRKEAAKPKVMRPGLIRDICSSLSKKPHSVALSNTLSLLEPIVSGAQPQPKLLKQLSEFVVWMLRDTGIQSSTAKVHLENLSTVLFPMLTTLDLTIDNPDQWEAMYENMLKDESKYSKSINAVTTFSDFLTRSKGVEFSSVGFSSAAATNANILTKQQKDIAVSRIRLKLQNADPRLSDIACNLVELAYGLGARRWELLGLHFRDIRGPLELLIRFVRNSSRGLKTDASTRQLPLAHLAQEPFFKDWLSFVTCKPGEDKDTNILLARGFDISRYESRLFAVITKALKEATGFNDVSFHSLRHSAACRLMLAIYWDDLEIFDLEKYDFFEQINSESQLIKNTLLRKNTENFHEHKAVSAFLGHLSFKTTATHYFHFYCLLRFGYMCRTNWCSPLKDEDEYLTAITGLASSSVDETMLDRLLYISDTLNTPVIKVATPIAKNHTLVLATDGEELKQNLATIAQATTSKTDQEKSVALTVVMPHEHHRDAFIKLFNQRISALQSRYSQVGLLKKSRTTASQVAGDNIVFLMPSHAAIQSAIGAILSEVERHYPKTAQRRELAKKLMDAMAYFSPKDHETFSFGPKDDLENILNPVMSLLNRSPVHICYWHRTKQRIDKKGPRDVNGTKVTASTLAELPNISKGRLMVRIEASNKHENFKPAALAWVMGALYLAYGHTYTP